MASSTVNRSSILCLLADRLSYFQHVFESLILLAGPHARSLRRWIWRAAAGGRQDLHVLPQLYWVYLMVTNNQLDRWQHTLSPHSGGSWQRSRSMEVTLSPPPRHEPAISLRTQHGRPTTAFLKHSVFPSTYKRTRSVTRLDRKIRLGTDGHGPIKRLHHR